MTNETQTTPATPIELTQAIADARDAANIALTRADALVDRFPDDPQMKRMYEAAYKAAKLADSALAVKNHTVSYYTKP